MTLILSGTDNSATSPAVTGTDTDTGIYYPTSNQVAIATNGTQAMLVNASQNTTFAGTVTANTVGSAAATAFTLQSAGTTALTLSTAQNATFAGTLATAAKGITAASLPAGSVLQVVSTTKTDTFSTTSTTPVDVTGLSVSITPSSATSKIFVTGSVCYGTSTANYLMGFLLVRNSTSICIADAAGSRSRWTFGSQGFTAPDTSAFSPINFLDSPATTSSTTYKIQAQAESPQTLWINRGAESDGDTALTGRFTSTITVMEIAA